MQRSPITLALLVLGTALSFLFGCGSAEDESSGSAMGQAQQRLTTLQARVFGFEAPTTDWSSASGTLTPSSTPSQGTQALAVVPNGWTEIVSTPLPTLEGVADTLSYDILVPEALQWGETRVVLRIPSQGVSWHDLGGVTLTGLAPGSYHTIVLSLDPGLVANLESAYSDLEVRLIINGPALAAPYLIDNLVLTTATDPEPDDDTPPPDSATEEIRVTLPQLSSPSDFAIAGSERVEIHDRAHVVRDTTGFAPVYSGQAGLDLGMDAMSGDLWSKGSILLRGKNEEDLVNVNGFARSASSVTKQNNAYVSGDTLENADFPIHEVVREIALPSTPGPSFTVGPDNLDGEILPGNHGDVTVFSRSKVTLAAGTYFFESLTIEPQVELVLQNADAPVYLYIRSGFTYHGTMTEAAEGRQRANLLVGYLGEQQVTLETPFIGTIYAPNATLELATTADGHEGAFFAKQVVVRPDVVVTHRPFPSLLITDVDVSKTTLCENEPVLVQVSTQSVSGSTTGQQPQVFIDGVNATSRRLQFRGTGERNIIVSAFDGIYADTRTIVVNIVECPTQPFADIVVTPTLNAYELEFTVMNHAALSGTNRSFVWDFGDGSTTVTDYPYTRHSYEGELDPETPTLQFEVTLTVQRDGAADVVTEKSVSLRNMYAEMAKRGFVRPPVSTSGRALVRDGKQLAGTFTVRNIEPDPLTFTERRLERHLCDADLDPELLPAEAIDVSVAAGATHIEEVHLAAAQFGSNTCGVSVHLTGTTADGLVARASGHFNTPEAGLFETPVTNPALRDLLNEVTNNSMTAEMDRVTNEELRVLALEQRIGEVPSIEDINSGALQAGGGFVGTRCDPEEAPPAPGLACLATDEWTVAPPLIRNAKKGDVLLVAACGTIGQLLRSLPRPQTYSHEGIMTRNYFALSHSTAAEGRIVDSVDPDGFLDGLVGTIFDENTLKYAWPGSLHESVNTAFNGLHIADPEGSLRFIHTFRPTPNRCFRDPQSAPPLVIRPPIGSDASVRPLLHQAADIANALEVHYRFFGYSQGNISFDGLNNFDGGDYRDPSGEPATVSSTFIWHALKNAGVVLEGDELEPYLRPNPITNSTSEIDDEAILPQGTGVVDGLYFYSEERRRAGADYIFDSTKNAVRTLQTEEAGNPIGAVIDFFNNMSDEVAAQFTNCFAFDQCGEDGIYKVVQTQNGPLPVLNTDFRNPGSGDTVSPDDFLFWDAPAFGDWEYLHYSSGEYRRIHRWAAESPDAGAVFGTVRLEDGSAVVDADVTLLRWSIPSGPQGEFRFDPVPVGTHVVYARKEVGNVLLEDREFVTVTPNENVGPVELVLTDDGPPTPTLEVFERRVSFNGEFVVFDDDNNNIFDPNDEWVWWALQGECVVSPFDRDDVVETGELLDHVIDHQGPYSGACSDDEVNGGIEVVCVLDEDNETVHVSVRAGLQEGDDCSGGGSILDEPQDAEDSDGPFAVPPNCPNCGTYLYAETGGNYVELALAIGNTQGESLGQVPDVGPENRRRVVMAGTVHLRDDEDWPFDDETKTVTFSESCIVDPFDRDSSFIWDGTAHLPEAYDDPDPNAVACVGDELRTEIHVTCRLADDNVRVEVDTDVYLYEGTSCVTQDQDGHEARAALLDPCEGGCVPVWMNAPNQGTDLVCRNEDEGGDRITVAVQMSNLQQ